MLIIANGAYKSGSTWLFYILRSVTGFPPVPKSFLNQRWLNPSINPRRLVACLTELDFSSKDFLVKNHFNKRRQRDQISKHENIFIFDIERDLRDVVVSAYYQHCRRTTFRGSFETYYWKWGRLVANGDCSSNAHPVALR